MDNNIDRLKELAGIQTERYSDDQLFGFTKQQIDDIRSLEAEIAGTTDHDELARLEAELDSLWGEYANQQVSPGSKVKYLNWRDQQTANKRK